MSKSIQLRMRYHKSTETLTLIRLEGHVPIGKPAKISCSASMKIIMKYVSDWVRVQFPEVGEYFTDLDIKSCGSASCKNITLDADFTFDNRSKKITLIAVDVFGQVPMWHHAAPIDSLTPLQLLSQYITRNN